MSKTGRQNYRRSDREQQTRHNSREHRITVRSVKRNPPDLRKLSRAVIALAMAEMEAEKKATAKAAAENSTDATYKSEEVHYDD